MSELHSTRVNSSGGGGGDRRKYQIFFIQNDGQKSSYVDFSLQFGPFYIIFLFEFLNQAIRRQLRMRTRCLIPNPQRIYLRAFSWLNCTFEIFEFQTQVSNDSSNVLLKESEPRLIQLSPFTHFNAYLFLRPRCCVTIQ